MARILTVDLRGRVRGGRSIQFLRAEMNGSMETRFALIRYSFDGVEPRTGLTIDLEKRSIFTRLGDPETDEVIERAAPEIADLIYPTVIKRDLALQAQEAAEHVSRGDH